MIEIVKSTGEANPPKVPYSPSSLTHEAAGTRARAAVSSQDYVRIFGGTAQHSRTPGSLPIGNWHLHWEATIESPAVAVLYSGDRVFAHRGGGWTLFDRQGKQIASGVAGNAAMLLDSNAGVFYSLGPGNMLRASGLNDGGLRFTIPLGYTEAYAWRLLGRSGKRLIAAATEQKMFAPQIHPPEQSLIQVIEVGSPLQLSPYKVLLSLDVQQDLIFKNPNLQPVVVGDSIWAVLPGLLVRISAAQEILGSWQDTFEPVSASADEAGWLHMVADAGGKRELWIVTPEGNRSVRVGFKPEFSPAGPPAIGYDHRVFLWTSHVVAAFSPEGAHLWDSAIPGGIRGLTVGRDGKVLVTAGGRVYALDPAGKSIPLLETTEAFTTAPVLTAEGDLLAGTATKVVCYRVK